MTQSGVFIDSEVQFHGGPNMPKRIHRLCVIPLLFAFAWQGSSRAQDPIEHFYLYDDADETIEGTLLGNDLYHDGSVTIRGEEVWMAWLEFVPGEGEHLWIGQRGKKGWIFRKRMTEKPGIYANPTLNVLGEESGDMWFSYEVEDNGQWDIFMGRLNRRWEMVDPIKVSESVGADIDHQMVPIRDAGIWFIWQSDQRGQFDILARWVAKDGSMATIEKVSDSPAGDWKPSVAAVGLSVFVTWDSYNGNDYDVLGRYRRGMSWEPIIPIATSPAFEGRARVAVNSNDEVWVTWEEGAEHWGHKYVSAYYPQKVFVSLTDERGPLHRFRKNHLAKLDIQSGAVFPAKQPLPMPSIEEALKRNPEIEEQMPIGAYYERGEIAFDGMDRLWLVYRHWYSHVLGIGPDHHYEEGIGVYARRLDANGWSKLYRLAPDQGDGIQRLSIVPTERGIEAVWTAGRTDRRPLNRPQGLAYASIEVEGEPGGSIQVAEPSTSAQSGSPEKNPSPPSMEFGGREFHLVYGDLHRHTDLSLCMVPADGSLDDVYRYAIDVAQLDFLGVTDHSRDIARGAHRSLLWWRSRKEVTRHRLSNTFFPYFAYERSRQDTDHNVISLKDDMLRPHEPPLPTFWEICDKDTFTIPHQPFFNSGLWEYNDNEMRPLLEIYQGCRDSTAEAPAHEGLSLGYQFGFIASSDHISTNASFASVWTDSVDRESIFRSLQARRTYGSTDKIQLAVQAGDHWMGEAFSTKQMPPIRIKAKGTDEISLVQVLVDGERVQSFQPNAQEIELEESVELPPGNHSVYVRLEQKDGNLAWASPFFVEVGE